MMAIRGVKIRREFHNTLGCLISLRRGMFMIRFLGVGLYVLGGELLTI